MTFPFDFRPADLGPDSIWPAMLAVGAVVYALWLIADALVSAQRRRDEKRLSAELREKWLIDQAKKNDGEMQFVPKPGDGLTVYGKDGKMLLNIGGGFGAAPPWIDTYAIREHNAHAAWHKKLMEAEARGESPPEMTE